jgi:hypothetical protein
MSRRMKIVQAVFLQPTCVRWVACGEQDTFIFCISNVRFMYFSFLRSIALEYSVFESTIMGQSCRKGRDVVEFGNYRRGKKVYIFGGIRPHQK